MIQHLACVMDGNRRWAKQRGLSPWEGHREGLKAAQATVDYCLERAIPYLTLYTFSIENLKRSYEEKNFLFDIIARFVTDTLLTEYKGRGVKVLFVGDRALFPEQLRALIERVEQETASGTSLIVQLLFCYGGQQEILAATQTLVERVASGVLSREAITKELFESVLWTGQLPAPDLVIRTGGNRRLSNFMPYQSAYSELYFSDTLWPDVRESFLDAAVDYFNSIQRNFGA